MNLRKNALTAIGAMALLAATAVPALAGTTAADSAQGTGTVKIAPGALTVSVTSANFGQFDYQFAQRTVGPQSIVITSEDLTGDGNGWQVNTTVSDFIGQDAGTDYEIPFSNLTLASGAISTLAGDADTSAMTVTYPAANPKLTWSAPADSGEGRYDLTVAATLLIPAGQRVDTYVATVEVEIFNAP